MTTPSRSKQAATAGALALVVVSLMALGVAAASTGFAGSSPPTPLSVGATGSQQWAFGGHAGATYSCSGSACGSNSTISGLSIGYYVEWVVIYTATNVSSSDTEYGVQAAINATLTFSIHECLKQTLTGPCTNVSVSGSLSGREVASGFTNVSNSGSVNLSSGTGAPGTVAALAIANAQSSASFNFSGSFSETLPVNGTAETASFHFDLGGSETSAISFATPLGIVPINPQPGQWWNSSAPFTATGSATSGYSVSVSAGGQSRSENHWSSSKVSPSGNLTVTGEDVGATTLYDNYTSPPSSVPAQIISLEFGAGNFSGAHGWLLLPSGLYSGASGALGGFTLVSGPPSAASASSGGETADYQSGVGFVGESAATSGSSLGVVGSGGPSFSIQAGPEPVSVAEQQYSAITANPSGSNAFPWVALVATVVVVVVVALVAVLLVRSRSRRRPPAPTSAPPTAAMGLPPPPPPP